jgi:hypothetical protein
MSIHMKFLNGRFEFKRSDLVKIALHADEIAMSMIRASAFQALRILVTILKVCILAFAGAVAAYPGWKLGEHLFNEYAALQHVQGHSKAIQSKVIDGQ